MDNKKEAPKAKKSAAIEETEVKKDEPIQK